MTDMTHTAKTARPWVRDPRDDPEKMNWWATLFNPFGTSPKLHFTRAWTLMFMARLLSVLIPYLVMAIVGMAGGNSGSLGFLYIPAMIIFPLTIFTSLFVHIRRLSDGGRPAVLAAFVVLPLILGAGGFLAMGYSALGGDKADPAQEASIETSGGEAEASATVSEAAGAAETPAAKDADADKKGKKPGPQQAIMIGAGLGGFLWWISGIGVMLWSLIYVARIPNGGDGAFTTESIAQGAAAEKRDYEIT